MPKDVATGRFTLINNLQDNISTDQQSLQPESADGEKCILHSRSSYATEKDYIEKNAAKQ